MSGRAGMTLVELLVALTITGAALAAGYGAFAGVTDQRARAASAMEAAARDAAVRRAIADWLRGATVSREIGAGFRGLDRIAGDSPDDELTFVTTSPTPAGRGESVVRLFLDRDDATGERGLVAVVAGAGGGRAERVALVPGATGLDIRYLSAVGERRWVPGWVSSTTLPAGIELAVTAAGPDTLPALARRPIRVAVGDGR